MAALNEKLRDLTARRNDVLSMTQVQCSKSNYGPGCGKKSMIREIAYLQTHWYTPPSGCSDGDYWNAGEGEWDCPHCGRRNRLYKLPEVEKLKHLFRGVVDTYDRKY